MAALPPSPQYSQTLMFNGLGMHHMNPVPNPGRYRYIAKISLPQLSTGSSDSSQVVAQLFINAVPGITGNPGAEGFENEGPLSAGEIISIELTSSAPIDQGLNVIKMTVSIFQESQT